MNKNTFCTVITFNYLPYAQALHHSINKFNGNTSLCVFIADKAFSELNEKDKEIINDLPPSIVLYYLNHLQSTPICKNLYNKYGPSDMDCFRWSMKSVFINNLLEVEKYDKVIYVDSDIFFFEDPQFLFDELETSNILLTPHWRSSDPEKDKFNFNHLFVAGIFNAGFIGVNKFGKEAMDWWAQVCLHQCVKDISIGQFVDQTYLNLFPVLFPKVMILKHKGCNIANWNQIDCSRSFHNSRVIIDKEWPVVFIHFTRSTITGIKLGIDSLLAPFLKEYFKVLKLYGIEINPDPKVEELTVLNYKKISKKIFKKIKGAIR